MKVIISKRHFGSLAISCINGTGEKGNKPCNVNSSVGWGAGRERTE